MFASLFGAKKVDANEGIRKIEGSLEMLEKREALLKKKIDKEVNDAKANLSKGNKKGISPFLYILLFF